MIRDIALAEGNERGDVIQFYNKVFIPNMKSYLLSLLPKKQKKGASKSKSSAKSGAKSGGKGKGSGQAAGGKAEMSPPQPPKAARQVC